jgi:hypothetical protein
VMGQKIYEKTFAPLFRKWKTKTFPQVMASF